MTETRPSCPSCQSISVVKNGSTRHGKQNYKCRDCNRQFVENPQWQKVSERTYDNYELLERLLLEKIPLAGIARVLKVSERWLQSFVNDKYENVAVGKETGKTNYIERFNCTLRQRVSRLVRKTLSFSKKLENHIGAIWNFIHHYNASLPPLLSFPF